ncbi:hypothetical protein V6N13_061990 [Hibiscus sabdariffa]
MENAKGFFFCFHSFTKPTTLPIFGEAFGVLELYSKKGYGWRIGSGKSVNIWNDPWLLGPRDDKLNSEVINTSYNIVSDLVDISTGSWKYGVIEDLFEENIEVRIHSIPLSSLDLPDELIWRHDGAGVYTAKSGYRLLLDEHDIGSAVISDSLSRFYNML